MNSQDLQCVAVGCYMRKLAVQMPVGFFAGLCCILFTPMAVLMIRIINAKIKFPAKTKLVRTYLYFIWTQLA